MNTGSLCALLGAMGCAAAFAACSSDGPSGTPAPLGTEAGTSGGSSGQGGKETGGMPSGSGGKNGAGGTSGSGGAATATGGAHGGNDSGAADAGTGGDPGDAAACVFPRCRPKYPEVPFPTANPFSEDKALLGKILFWDEQMGQLDTMACGTCHRGAAGGSDPRTNVANSKLKGPNGVAEVQPDILSDDLRGAQGVPVCDITGTITGTSPQTTGRKPPTYFDAMFGSQIFWDGRAGFCTSNEASGGCYYDPDVGAPAAAVIVGVSDVVSGFTIGGALEAQASGPPVNSIEMACAGRTWAALEAKLATVIPLAKAKAGSIPQDMKKFIADNGNSYPRMFKTAYGSDPKYKVAVTQPDDVVNARRIAFAIATHERRLTSDRTPWDLWNEGTPEHDDALDADELAGFVLFMGKAACASCHPPPLFTDNAFHNIGFHKPSWDPGRQAISNAPSNSDRGKFKTPTLRNVGLREPFGLLHEGDGPGHSLDTIMELYNTGGKRSDAEILPLIDTAMAALNLTPKEIAQVLKFLRSGLTDPRVEAETAPFDRPKLGTE